MFPSRSSLVNEPGLRPRRFNQRRSGNLNPLIQLVNIFFPFFRFFFEPRPNQNPKNRENLSSLKDINPLVKYLQARKLSLRSPGAKRSLNPLRTTLSTSFFGIPNLFFRNPGNLHALSRKPPLKKTSTRLSMNSTGELSAQPARSGYLGHFSIAVNIFGKLFSERRDRK